MTTAVAVIDTKELEGKLQSLTERGLAIKVTDDTGLIVADSFISDCLAMEKEIKEKFRKPVEKAFAAHRELTAWRERELSKVTPGKEHARAEKNAYEYKQKQIREAEEARLLKEAQKREEEERLKRAAEIEREAAALKALGQAEEAAEVQKEAEQVLATPAYIPPPRMAPAPKTANAMKMIVDRDRLQTICDGLNSGKVKTPPVIPGVNFYRIWQFEVHNPGSVPEAWRKPS